MNTEIEKEVKKLIKQGFKLELISLEMDIAIEQLKQWKKEMEEEKQECETSLETENLEQLMEQIELARKEGNLGEEKKLLERLLEITPDNSSAIRRLEKVLKLENQDRLYEITQITYLIEIARLEENLEEEKRLLRRKIDLEPDDDKAKKRIKKIEKEERLSADSGDIKKIGILIKIARGNRDIEKEKKLLERILELEPENIMAISSLIRIAKEQGNIKEEKRLLKRRLEIEPDSVRTISSLIRIAREEGNIEEEKRLLERLLELDSNNVIAIASLANIARKKGDREEEKRLLLRELELEPENTIAMKRLAKITGKCEEKVDFMQEESQDLFKLVSEEETELTPAERARRIIHESENILEDLKKIAAITEQEDDETIRILVQAEAAVKAKLIQRAEELLKRYKKFSQSQGDTTAVNIVNKAIALSKNAKMCDPLKWEALHTAYAEMRKKEEVSTDDSDER